MMAPLFAWGLFVGWVYRVLVRSTRFPLVGYACGTVLVALDASALEQSNLKMVGACLLGIWGLPLPIVEAVALHHQPAQLFSKAFCALTAVHVANALEHAARRGNFDDTLVVDVVYLEELGLTGRLEEWQQICEAQSVAR